jgi:hypothetical protein
MHAGKKLTQVFAFQGPHIFFSVSILKWLILLQKNPHLMLFDTVKLFDDYLQNKLFSTSNRGSGIQKPHTYA